MHLQILLSLVITVQSPLLKSPMGILGFMAYEPCGPNVPHEAYYELNEALRDLMSPYEPYQHYGPYEH